MATSKIKEVLQYMAKFMHKDRNTNPTSIDPGVFVDALMNIAESPNGRLSFSAPAHLRRGIGVEGILIPRMSFFRTTGDTDEFYRGIYAFCNCKCTDSSSVPCIRLSSVADIQDDEHIITTDITLTSAGVLYKAEITEEEWFGAFQRGLGIPLTNPEQGGQEAVVEDWLDGVDSEHRMQLIERASEMIYEMGRCFPANPGAQRRYSTQTSFLSLPETRRPDPGPRNPSVSRVQWSGNPD